MSNFIDVLVNLGRYTQSVMLTTSEDNLLWECSVIIGGKRIMAFSSIEYPALAVERVISRINSEFGQAHV